MKWTIETGKHLTFHITNGLTFFTTVSRKAAEWLCDILNKQEAK